MKDLTKKWWFWIIILLIVLILTSTTIILIGFNLINPEKNLTSLAKELQAYNNDIVVYQSAGKNTIEIECYFKDEEEIEKQSKDIGEIIGKYLDYLIIYNDIKMNMYSDEGAKVIFTIDIATNQIIKETEEIWTLKDSVAYLKEEEKLKELQNKEEQLNSNISTLENTKDELNEEIEKLNEDVIKLKGESKTYPAGHLTAGIEVPIGKYKIYGGSSNFIVYSSNGSLQVNIILGSESYKVSEYIYTFKDGDKIQAASSFKLVSVE